MPILAAKEEEKKILSHPFLSRFTCVRISKYRNQNQSQMSKLIQARKAQFQDGKKHNEWLERSGAAGERRQNPEVRLGSLNSGAWG